MATINPTDKQEIIFVRILIPFILGIVSFYGCTSTWIQVGLLAVSIVLFAYLLFRKYLFRKTNISLRKGINGLIFYVFIFSTSSLHSILYNDYIYTDYHEFKNSEYLKIRIYDEPENRPNIILFKADIIQSAHKKRGLNPYNEDSHVFKAHSGKIKVSILKNAAFPSSFQYGDELIVPNKLLEIPPAINPSEFNYRGWLATQNIYHQIILKPDELILLNTNGGNWLRRTVIALRAEQVSIYRSLIKNDDDFAVASTLILGYRSDLSQETFDNYSKTGTIHALSVSGMHVGLLYIMLSHALWFLDRKIGAKYIKTFVLLASIWFYTLLTGNSPSALRACIMISVYIIAKTFTKRTNNYNIIAFTAFSLLLYNPFYIWDVGFQLSFTAVLGLIYLQPKIENFVSFKQPWLVKIWEMVSMSLAAQLMTYPLSVYYFHQFPVYFLLSNLFLILPAALIMYIGILILIFRIYSLGPSFEWLINFTNSGLAKIANLPFSGITAIWISKMELFLLSLALLLFIIACDKFHKKLLYGSLIIFLGLQSSISYHKFKALHQKKIINFTLRQNYAVAAISAQEATLFTDLKPGSKAYNYSIKPALDQHSVTKITFVTLDNTDD